MWPFSRKRVAWQATPVRVRARYDAVQDTAENRNHWANADSLAADAALSKGVRTKMRNRARYEVQNNSYARGIVQTLANDVIGTGPRLRALRGNGTDSAGNREIEVAFAQWARSINLAAKLRLMVIARAQDGEAFAKLVTNPAIPGNVQLDLEIIEADRVTGSRVGAIIDPGDGIDYDEVGNPIAYHVLKVHPGGMQVTTLSEEDVVPASSMIHWFRMNRPGQLRGVPDILPALPLFAQLRRFTLAVIAAAESAADVAVFMKTNMPEGGEAAAVEPMAEMEFQPRMAVFGPEGWEPSQIKAEQPATTYDMFKREILNEIARCFNMPYNIAAGNSSSYNYASGRMDHQTYYKSLEVEQADCEIVAMDRIFQAWLREFTRSMEPVPVEWLWPGTEHVDPSKEASAQATRLANHTTTYAREYARQGEDWEDQLRQRARELELMSELGLSASSPAAEPDNGDNKDEDEEETRSEAA